jgi:hypothetical protein
LAWYRVTCFGQPVGPWRLDKRKVYRDAIERELGSFDESGQFYITVPGDIQVRQEEEYRELEEAQAMYASA